MTGRDVADPLEVADASRDRETEQYEVISRSYDIDEDGYGGVVVDEDRFALGHSRWKSDIYPSLKSPDLNSLCWW